MLPPLIISAAAIRSVEKRTNQTLKSAEIKRKQLEALHAGPPGADGRPSFWGFKWFMRKGSSSDASASHALSLRMELEVLDDLGRELLLEVTRSRHRGDPMG